MWNRMICRSRMVMRWKERSRSLLERTCFEQEIPKACGNPENIGEHGGNAQVIHHAEEERHTRFAPRSGNRQREAEQRLGGQTGMDGEVQCLERDTKTAREVELLWDQGRSLVR